MTYYRHRPSVVIRYRSRSKITMRWTATARDGKVLAHGATEAEMRSMWMRRWGQEWGAL